MELTDEVRDRIKAEEIFRDEIRRRLASADRRSWWDVLNSSFMMWLLGSVVLSLIVNWYAAAREAENKRAAAAVAAESRVIETTRRLAALQDEILSRYSRLSLILQVDNDAYRFDRARRAIDGIGDEAGNPEFAGTSIEVLLKRFEELSCVTGSVWGTHAKHVKEMQLLLRQNAASLPSDTVDELTAMKTALLTHSTFQLIASKQISCGQTKVLQALSARAPAGRGHD